MNLLNTLFPNNLSLFSSLNVRDHVSHSYRTTGRIIFLCILIFTFFEVRREERSFGTEWCNGENGKDKEIAKSAQKWTGEGCDSLQESPFLDKKCFSEASRKQQQCQQPSHVVMQNSSTAVDGRNTFQVQSARRLGKVDSLGLGFTCSKPLLGNV
jgi:hypothetical protein